MANNIVVDGFTSYLHITDGLGSEDPEEMIDEGDRFAECRVELSIPSFLTTMKLRIP